jgi:hypothetical protein
MEFICPGSNGNRLQNTSGHLTDGNVDDCAVGIHVNMDLIIVGIAVIFRNVAVARMRRGPRRVVLAAPCGGVGDVWLVQSVFLR